MVRVYETRQEAEVARDRVAVFLMSKGLPGKALTSQYDLTRWCVYVETSAKQEVALVKQALKIAGLL